MKKIIALISLTAFTVYISNARGYSGTMLPVTFYADLDNDGYGDPFSSIIANSPPPPGYVYNNWDCDDANSGIRPTAYEVCNGIDDNCNGLIDLDDPQIQGVLWYADGDGDGYRDPATVVIACSSPPGYLSSVTFIDCDDTDPAIHLGAQEICNGLDDNCDGLIDPEVCNGIDDDCDGLIDDDDQGVLLSTFYVDYDGDAHYNIYATIVACTAPMGWISGGVLEDCNDTDGNASGDCPSELCNGIDDDGDGLIDDNDPDLAQLMIPWYADADGDGYGDPDNLVMACCSHPVGYLPWPNNGDCDDTDPSIKPGAQELCNGIDDDCDGLPDPETCNGIDTDCDGVPDAFDVCPGGDDSVDNNEDGIADCSQLLNYYDYSPDWHCGNNKIYVCHNDNNPQTICIDGSALTSHYNHSDNIGPCTSCPQNLILPGNNGIPIAIEMAELAEKAALTLIDYSDKFNSHEDEVLFKVIPNPADDHIEVQINLSSGVISVMDVSGKVVIQQSLSGHKNIVNTGSLMDGIYFIRLENGSDCYSKSIVVIH